MNFVRKKLLVGIQLKKDIDKFARSEARCLLLRMQSSTSLYTFNKR